MWKKGGFEAKGIVCHFTHLVPRINSPSLSSSQGRNCYRVCQGRRSTHSATILRKVGGNMRWAVVSAVVVSAVMGHGAMGGTITGTVTQEPSGTPIVGLWVNANEYATNEWRAGGSTNSDGQYSIAGLTAGTYRVQVSTHGTDFIHEFFDNVLASKEATSVAVPSVGVVQNINFSLKLGALTVSGKVTDKATGLPLAGIPVTYWNDDCEVYDYTDTGANGTYRLPGLLNGPASIVAAPSSYYAYIGAHFDLTANVSDLNFALPKGATLAGQVLDAETGQPAQGVEVTFWNERVAVYRAEVTTKQGTFAMACLPPGIGEVEVVPSIDTGYARWDLPGGADWVYLTEGGDKQDFSVQLRRGALVIGYVKDSKGNPLRDIECGCSGQLLDGQSETDVTGLYEMRVPIGTYIITMDDDNLGALPQRVSVTDISRPVVVPDMIAYSVQTGSQVSGFVNASNAHPSTGNLGVVALETGVTIDPNTWFTTEGVSSVDLQQTGSFAITKLPPGVNYDLLLLAGTPSPDGPESYTVKDRATNVPGGTTGVSLYYPSGGSTVSGTVLDPAGSPLLGAVVLLMDQTTGRLAGWADVDYKGGYAFYGVPAGKYMATAIHSFHRNASAAVEVVEGTPANVATMVMALAYDVSKPLAIGTPYTVGISSDQWQSYRLDVDPNKSLLVTVTPASTTADLELYGRYAQPATRARSDSTAKVKNVFGGYELLISPTVGGTYYFSVRGADVDGTVNYTITASLVDRHVSDAYPRIVPNSAAEDIHILGLGFVAGMQIELKTGTTTIAANTVVSSSAQMVIGQFDLSTARPGKYDVSIVWPDGNRVLIAEAIEIQSMPVGVLCSFDLNLTAGQNWSSNITVPSGLSNLFVTLQKTTLTYYGDSWSSTLTLKHGTQQVAGDNRNSHDHMLQVQNPTAGAYTINVTAANAGKGILRVWDKLPELPMGQWVVGKIHSSYGSVWYQVAVAAGQEKLRLEGDGLGFWSHFDIYRTQYKGSEHWVGPSNTQTSIEIPNPQPGTYIVEFMDSAMLYAGSSSTEWLTDQSRDVMIRANTTTTTEPSPVYLPTITSLSTNKGGNTGRVTVTIKGAWLDPNATVSLIREGQPDIIAQTVLGDPNRTSLTATLNLNGKSPAQYSLTVTNPDGQTIAASKPFIVEQGGQPELWLQIVGREKIRARQWTTFILRYGNSGDSDAAYPHIAVSLQNAFQCEVQGEFSGVLSGGENQVAKDPNSVHIVVLALPLLPPGVVRDVVLRVKSDITSKGVLSAAITMDQAVVYSSMLSFGRSLFLDLVGGNIRDLQQVSGTLARQSESTPPSKDTSSSPPADSIMFWSRGRASGGLEWHSAKSLGNGDFVEIMPDSFGEGHDPGKDPDVNIKNLADAPYPDWEYWGAYSLPGEPIGEAEIRARVQRLREKYGIDPGDPHNRSEYTGYYCNSQFLPDELLRTFCFGLVFALDYDKIYMENGWISPQEVYDQIRLDTDPTWTERMKNKGGYWDTDAQAKTYADCFGKFKGQIDTFFETIDSTTPEDKYGPAGFDPGETPSAERQRLVWTGRDFYYKVDFWNKEDATAPACDVLVADRLDPNVDAQSFRFDEVGFRKWTTKLEPCQYFNVNVDMRPDVNLVVNVEGRFDQANRQLTWEFRSLDPATWKTPEDPMAGFLPPITASGEEVGWVAFSVRARASLGTGDKIRNQAFVEFDHAGDLMNHPAPKEGPWLNTIDAGAATSQVQAFSEKSTRNTSIAVKWSGQDDAGGSGIRSYDIYVRDNSGAYTRWLADADSTSATYTGQVGHTYAFYSVARDNVGNVEQGPQTADATITVLSLSSRSPVYRFWSPGKGVHFYTISESEKNKLISSYSDVWTYEGIVYYAFTDASEPGVAPVYRFWSASLGTHFYTIKEAEKQKLIRDFANVWTYEGTAFYAYPEGQQPADASPVYRFWSPAHGTHFYTISEGEKEKLTKNYSQVWTYEGIAWYAYNNP
jgi:hypothetical protein